MPPFWWNVKQATLLQYDVHEFKTFYSRELFYINVVKIYLQRHYLYNSLMKINIKSSRATEIIEHIASGPDGHQSFGQLQSTVEHEARRKSGAYSNTNYQICSIFIISASKFVRRRFETNLGMDGNNEQFKGTFIYFLGLSIILTRILL